MDTSKNPILTQRLRVNFLYRPLGGIFLLSLLLFGITLEAQENLKRKTVGLVLSGGGARGGAHLGVIKVFEKHHIPIDAIVGTSMGSFIGGLYASGMSTDEIESMLVNEPWVDVIAKNYDRDDIPFRRKTLQRDFAADAKIGINSDNEMVFASGLFAKQGMLQFLKDKTYNVKNIKNFDNLNIPFRSVTSRLKDGETVSLKGGSLAEAIYASIAIPGGFEPITINSEVLVDGGVADNLPIDIMRNEMDVDYIVVVDISTPYDDNASFNDYFSVAGQLVNILMRKNVEVSLDSMKGKDNEILLRPNLEGFAPLDSDKYAQIIAIGEKETEMSFEDKLKKLVSSEDVYAQYKKEISTKVRAPKPIINSIEIDNSTYLNNKKIKSYLNVKLGERLEHNKLEKDLHNIYSLMIFDEVKYEVIEKDDENVLKVISTPSWDSNGQVRFSLGFEDNFQGHNDYFVKMEYIKFGLNSYAGEWRSRVSIGLENLLSTEIYQPLDPYDIFYIRPSIYYRDKKVYVSPVVIGSHDVKADLDQTIVTQAKEYGAALSLGVNITNDFRLDLSAELKNVAPSTEIIISDSTGLSLVSEEEDADVFIVKPSLEYDDLDDPFFPSKGVHAKTWVKQSHQFNASSKFIEDVKYKQYYVEYISAITYEKHSLIPTFKFGETFNVDGDIDDVDDFNSFFTLGGLFSLSGLPTNAVTGNNMAFASMMYRYSLSEKDYFGSFSVPLYVGMSAETGTAWYGNGAFSRDRLLYAGSVYLAADTLLGPFYLGFGTTEFDYYSVYISLGKSF